MKSLKKKIIILFVSILIIFSVILIFLKLRTNKNKIEQKNYGLIKESENRYTKIEEVVEPIENTIIEDTEIENGEQQEESISNEETEGIDDSKVVEENQKIEDKISQVTVEKQENTKVIQDVETPKNSKKEIVQQTPIIEEQQQNTNDNVQEQQQENTQIPENNQEQQNNTQIQENTQEQEKTEEYRYNSEMTQKMINMINNNQNENMKQYGYTVVVDSSIKSLTNPFTYTDERLLIKTKVLCGEIKVYAEDYYLNGTYFSTDCYIY